jgi:hypothetical protein
MSESNVTKSGIDELVAKVIEGHNTCRSTGRAMILQAIENGENLLALKAAQPHGAWEVFVRVRFPISLRSLQRYMQLAEAKDRVLPALEQEDVDSINGALRVARGLPAAEVSPVESPAIVATPAAVAALNVSLEHLSHLLRLRGIYSDEIVAEFDEWDQGANPEKIVPGLFAEPCFVWSLLRAIRPEDQPLHWFGELLKGKSPHGQVIADGCEAFVRSARETGLRVPQWEVAAFWWGCVALDAELTAEMLGRGIDGWEERFLSAILGVRLHKDMPQSAPQNDQEKADWKEYWGYRSDLRHSNASSLATSITEPTKVRLMQYLERLGDAGMALPSSLQPWSLHYPTDAERVEACAASNAG